MFKALADPHRVAIVEALAEHGSMCGTELSERLGVSLALLCHHWDVLLDAGLVKKQRVGQQRICTLDAERLQDAMRPFQPATETKEKALAPAREKKPKPAAKRASKRTRSARG